ncbi:MAG: RagB/SusD family nutrient uptake outer membrane protein [Prevotella sp.]|nr:RagB/SusD family nutrient uptake outer membrane protein [Prevotella sp.]
MKAKYILSGVLVAAMTVFSSCSDFFDQESDHVTFTDNMHLNDPADTIYTLTGIMAKMQALGDRTILLGEARGDLVDVTNAASSDLRDIAQFNIGDDNQYNNPRDYYAVINNCNLYIAKADTALKNNRNQNIFLKEYAAVKAYRAWTYLQLAINYGRVPFVTEPIVTKAQSDATYETKDITDICNWLVNDIAPLADQEMPGLGSFGITDSRLLYFPIYVVMGDLNLWAGNYADAAKAYYNAITNANGANTFYPIGSNGVRWISSGNWNSYNDSWRFSFSNESYNSSRELMTMIAGDSIPSDGNYSQLRNIFNSNEQNNYEVSLVPSQAIQDLSAAQVYCMVTSDGDTIYAPSNLSMLRSGDLRLMSTWTTVSNYTYNNRQIDYQSIVKHSTRNVHIYRRAMLYLRLAEALNRAGYPRFAYQILSSGVNDKVIASKVLPYCTTAADSAFVSSFSFPSTSTTGYIVADLSVPSQNYNTIGIHSRGSGWSQANKYYLMPDDSTLNATDRLNYQIDQVERMIVDEGALECAFEGTRYYDLMRVALRRNDPSFLADRVYGRRGAAHVGEMKSEIKKDLLNTNNWFLSWKGKIGL